MAEKLATTTRGRLMRLDEHVVGDVIVLTPSGRMTRDEDFGAVKRRVEDLVDAGRRKLVLDLGAVSYMDSTCLGEVVSGFVTVRKQGGTLHLANLTARVERLMTISQLTKVFQLFGSEREAVLSLAPEQRES